MAVICVRNAKSDLFRWLLPDSTLWNHIVVVVPFRFGVWHDWNISGREFIWGCEQQGSGRFRLWLWDIGCCSRTFGCRVSTMVLLVFHFWFLIFIFALSLSRDFNSGFINVTPRINYVELLYLVFFLPLMYLCIISWAMLFILSRPIISFFTTTTWLFF